MEKKVLSFGIILQYSVSHDCIKITTAIYLNWFLSTSASKIERLLVNLLMQSIRLLNQHWTND